MREKSAELFRAPRLSSRDEGEVKYPTKKRYQKCSQTFTIYQLKVTIANRIRNIWPLISTLPIDKGL